MVKCFIVKWNAMLMVSMPFPLIRKGSPFFLKNCVFTSNYNSHSKLLEFILFSNAKCYIDLFSWRITLQRWSYAALKKIMVLELSVFI